MDVSRDNIAGFLLGVSLGVAVGFVLKAPRNTRQEEADAEYLRWSGPTDAVSKLAATRLKQGVARNAVARGATNTTSPPKGRGTGMRNSKARPVGRPCRAKQDVQYSASGIQPLRRLERSQSSGLRERPPSSSDTRTPNAASTRLTSRTKPRRTTSKARHSSSELRFSTIDASMGSVIVFGSESIPRPWAHGSPRRMHANARV